MRLGPTVLLPSGRTGRQIATNRSDKPVYIDSQGKATCHHGERAASIMAWIALERADASYTRPSVCDCENIDGLLTEYDYENTPDPTRSLPLYKFLGAIGAEEKTVSSRPQRKALGSGDKAVWVQPAGTLVCTHGNTRKMIARMIADDSKRFKCKSIQKCRCALTIPRRVGSVFACPPRRHHGSRAEGSPAGLAEAEPLGGGAVAEIGDEVVVGLA